VDSFYSAAKHRLRGVLWPIFAPALILAIDQCRLALKDAPSDETAAYHLVVALRLSGHGNDDEMKALVKRLSEMHQASLQHETDRKRYRLVEQETAPHK
jgi:hypothetical protein